MSVDSDNIMRLHENAKRMNAKIDDLQQAVSSMQSTIAILQSELNQNKQLVMHVMTRGSGATK